MTAWLDSRFAGRAVLSVAFCGLLAAAALGQGTTSTLALRGDLAPDGSGAFVELQLPKLNDAGQVVFGAIIGPSFDEQGVYRAERVAPLVQIARTGFFSFNQQFVGTTLGYSDLNNAGQVVFLANVAGATHQDPSYYGIFLGSGGAITEVVRQGEPLAFFGFADATLGALGPTLSAFHEGPTLNDFGRVSFWGDVDACEPIIGGCSPVNFDAVFLSNTNGSVDAIAREGNLAPVAGGGVSGTFDDFVGPAIFFLPTVLTSNSGNVVFRATAANPDSEGLFWSDGSQFFPVTRVVARNGQALIPGSPGTIQVSSPENPPFVRAAVDLNDAGEVAFWAQLNPGDNGIYRWSPQQASVPGAHGLTEIARSGQASPDGNGTIGGPSYFEVQLNEQGQVAFLASIIPGSGTSNEGVFRGDGQALTLIARKGQLTPDGQRRFGGFLHAAINDAGLVLFQAGMRDLDNQLLPGSGLYLSDGVQLIEVMRPGQPLAGSIVQSVSLVEEDAVNAVGQVAYFAILEDDRDGIFLFTPFVVGDYNVNGIVDAADYPVWRKNVGTFNILSNDPIGGMIGPAHYTQWRTHFGQTVAGGSGAAASDAAAPEPTSFVLLLSMGSLIAVRRCSRTTSF